MTNKQTNKPTVRDSDMRYWDDEKREDGIAAIIEEILTQRKKVREAQLPELILAILGDDADLDAFDDDYKAVITSMERRGKIGLDGTGKNYELQKPVGGDRSNKLLAAQALVEEVMSTLNIREQQCSHCQTNRRDNWAEYQMHTELKAISQKLFKMAGNEICTGRKSR